MNYLSNNHDRLWGNSPPNQQLLFIKVAIISAIAHKVALLRNQIENRQTLQRVGNEIYTSQTESVDGTLLKSCIGKVSSAIGTTLLLYYC